MKPREAVPLPIDTRPNVFRGYRSGFLAASDVKNMPRNFGIVGVIGGGLGFLGSLEKFSIIKAFRNTLMGATYGATALGALYLLYLPAAHSVQKAADAKLLRDRMRIVKLPTDWNK